MFSESFIIEWRVEYYYLKIDNKMMFSLTILLCNLLNIDQRICNNIDWYICFFYTGHVIFPFNYYIKHLQSIWQYMSDNFCMTYGVVAYVTKKVFQKFITVRILKFYSKSKTEINILMEFFWICVQCFSFYKLILENIPYFYN